MSDFPSIAFVAGKRKAQTEILKVEPKGFNHGCFDSDQDNPKMAEEEH